MVVKDSQSCSHHSLLTDLQFAAEFCLQMETLFRGVAIMDKFLSMETLLKKDRLQLTGIASLLLAIKLDEMQPPEWSR